MKKLVPILILLCSNAFALEVHFEQDRSLPLVHVFVAVPLGSTCDSPEKEGLTHIMSRMLLEGTKRTDRRKVLEKLDSLGGSITAFVQDELTVVSGSVLSQNIAPFLKLLSEIVMTPRFSPKELARVKNEVISELKQSSESDRYLAEKNLKKLMFEGHPFSNLIKGSVSSVSKITVSDLQRKHNTIFTNDLLFVVGSGDTSTENIQQWANALGAGLPKGEKANDLSFPLVRYIPHLWLVDKPQRTQSTVLIGHSGILMSRSDFFPLQLGVSAFGGSNDTAWLTNEVRNKRGWSYGAYSYFSFGSKPKAWKSFLQPGTQYTGPAIKLVLDLIKKLKTDGISKELYASSKKTLINNSAFVNNTPQKRAINRLIELTRNLPKGFFDRSGEKYEEVTYEEVNAALKNFVRPETLSIVVVGTAKDILPQIRKNEIVSEELVKVKNYLQD